MADPFDIFLENLIFKGLEHFNKYYGTYRAVVSDNKDPEKRGRVKLYCPDLGQTVALNIWVDPEFDMAGKGHGMFWPPEIDDFVRVTYSHGNPSTPNAYRGGWYIKDGLPAKLGHDTGGNSKTGTAPIMRGFVTKAGHTLSLNDKKDKESIELSWKDGSAKLTIDEKATLSLISGKSHLVIDIDGKKIEIVDENKNTILLDSNGVTVTTNKDVKVTADGGVTVKGASIALDSSKVTLTDSSSEPAVKGTTMKNWLLTHTHGTGVGPSTPPIEPIPPAMLSTKAKLD